MDGPKLEKQDTETNQSSDQSRDPLGQKSLDELLRFINGVNDNKAKSAESKQSSKLAKRARQRQRKVGPDVSWC